MKHTTSAKRYFTSTVQPGTTAFHCESEWHYMSLPGPTGAHDGGYVIVMLDGEFEPDPDWTELPHLLERKQASLNGINTTPGPFVAEAGSAAPEPLAGIAVTDMTYQVAKKLAAINRHFHP